MMKPATTALSAAALSVIAAAGGFISSPCGAVPLLDTFQASALVQSTASDTDSAFLGDFFGFLPGQVLNYNSTSTVLGWSGTLSGTYLGTPLSLGYSGNLTGIRVARLPGQRRVLTALTAGRVGGQPRSPI